MASETSPLIPKLPKVIIKLDRTNYLLWKSQLLPIFYGSDTIGMIDGTISAPSETIVVDSKTICNPAYSKWKKNDQLLLSWLHTTMTPAVFAQVINYKTAHSTWEALSRAYTSQTNARYYQIKHDLSTIRKGSSSITEYMDRIRLLSDELSLIQQPMSDREIIGCVLDGLDLDYDVVVNTVHTMSTPPSFEELYSMLLNREKRLEVYHNPSSTQSTAALFTTSNRAANRGNGRDNGRGRGNFRGRGNGRGNGRRNSHSYNQSPKTSQDSLIKCQICNKPGHGALTCRHRANYSYQPDDVPTAFSAMSLQSSYDPTWFPDTGATHHMTADDSAFINRQDYHGPDQVTVANGKTLPISSTGPLKSSNSDMSWLKPAEPNHASSSSSLLLPNFTSTKKANTTPEIAPQPITIESQASPQINQNPTLPTVPICTQSSPNPTITNTSSQPLDNSAPPQPIIPLTDTQLVHPMVTRSRDGTRKPLVPYTGLSTRHPLPTCLHTVIQNLDVEPTCYTEASKFPHWQTAMLDEFNALLKQRTWSLVPASKATNLISSLYSHLGIQLLRAAPHNFPIGVSNHNSYTSPLIISRKLGFYQAVLNFFDCHSD
ncbi:hypothetical protein LWI29_017933 [Acer saccharum]|uniref:Retrotransposon Copia-like N-terminal domain-containing protein n=1 Tax=Acer saccharum TaxID=4024 RepID=A0AA39S5I9_ACESA|nr:hypothetical protein LWI29_017933 [Acer saccharum]